MCILSSRPFSFCKDVRPSNVRETDGRDKQEMYGHLNCKECGQRFSSPINSRPYFEPGRDGD